LVIYCSNWCNCLLNDITILYLTMKKIFLIIILFFIFTIDSYSQCSMLSAIMESEQAYDSAKSLNNGIVYLMALPYIMVFVIIWIIYNTNKVK